MLVVGVTPVGLVLGEGVAPEVLVLVVGVTPVGSVPEEGVAPEVLVLVVGVTLVGSVPEEGVAPVGPVLEDGVVARGLTAHSSPLQSKDRRLVEGREYTLLSSMLHLALLCRLHLGFP